MNPSYCHWITIGEEKDWDTGAVCWGGVFPDYKRWQGQPPWPFTKTGKFATRYVLWVEKRCPEFIPKETEQEIKKKFYPHVKF